MVTHEPKFLSENLVIFPAIGKGPKYLFVFPRSRSAMVEEMVAYLKERLSSPVSLEPSLASATVE